MIIGLLAIVFLALILNLWFYEYRVFKKTSDKDLVKAFCQRRMTFLGKKQ